MREADAIYGGEMSAHHYFRDFSYCDSGMIPWLLVTQIMSDTGKTLSELVGERMRLYPASGEINRRVPDAQATLAAVSARYAGRRVAWTTRTGSASSSRTGASICARPTPSR